MGISFLKQNIARFNNNVSKNSLKGGHLCAWLSEVYCFIRFGASPDDYFRYQFYRKSNFERDKFITYRRSKKLISTFNNADSIVNFYDKATFNTVFKKFIKREWLDMRVTDETAFHAFLEKHGKIIMKPMHGGQGKGVFFLTAEEYDSSKFDEYKDCIAEELLIQSPVMEKLNASSVNTIRVLTFKGKVIACGLRIGGEGSPVDNFHISDGICCHLDVETGVIDMCIDNPMNKYVYHPVTGLKLLGFEIPMWDEVKRTVEEAVKIVPGVQYIGWDVAILKDGVALIEGNHDPGHDIVQMVAQNGLYESIRKLM